MKKVCLSYGCFANLVTSCVEVYDKEALGLVCGRITPMRVVLHTSYPFQEVKRWKGKTEIKDIKRYIDSINTIEDLNLEVIGYYHSHPKGVAIPSEEDIRSSIATHYILGLSEEEKLLEILVEINKKKFKKYSRRERLWFGLDEPSQSQSIGGDIRFGRSGYRFEIVGYWIGPKYLRYHVDRDVTMADLDILESDLKKFFGSA